MATHLSRHWVFSTAAAIIAWAGVLLQFVLSMQLAIANGKGIVGGIISYFGYFTILTNILVALTLSIPLIAPTSPLGRFFSGPDIVTAVATAITLVGGAYFFLLRNVWDPQGWQLIADVVLHYVTPMLFLVHWWLSVRRKSLTLSDIPKWMLYPLAYMGYTLIRGKLIGLYPYYFIDVSALGYPKAIANAMGLLLAYALVAAVLVAIVRLNQVTR